MEDLVYGPEVYSIIGACMTVHRYLGHGFLEVVYKGALELELVEQSIPFKREKEFEIKYKGQFLKHRFFADFLLMDDIIMEIKSTKEGISREYMAQTLNYLKVSGCKLGLIVNFGKCSLEYKRLLM